MQPLILSLFKDEIFSRFPPPGRRILEVGAAPRPFIELLVDPARDQELVVLDLQIPEALRNDRRFIAHTANANDLSRFSNDYFDAVVAVGIFNNDPFFWRSLAELRRVLRPGGLFYVHAPVFSVVRWRRDLKSFLYKGGEKFRWSRLTRWAYHIGENTWISSVPTYHYSATPRDYYRFTQDSVREVLLEGFEVLHLIQILNPPRIIAVGQRL